METIPGLALDRRALDRARVSRDPRFDGRFFIAVVSTGIYCRPICPAPSPKRVNVRYYATAAAAHEAGFRPCLRCRPEAAPGTPAWLGTSVTVRRALRLIHDGALDAGSVDDLAGRLGIGPRHLHRLFVQHLGASPIAIAQTRRLHFAKRLIDETDLPLTQVALAAGFGSLRRFNDAFLRAYTRPPRELRRARRGKRPATAGELTLRLAFRPPYAWDRLLEFLATRALPGVESVRDGCYARTLSLGGAPVVVRIGPGRDASELDLRVQHAEPASLDAIVSRVRQMLDLAADPELIRSSLERDVVLRPLVRRCPGLRVPGALDPFELAVRAVLGQQVSVAAGRTLAGRLVARCGTPWEGGDGLTHLFPTPAQVADADLRQLGVTTKRASTLGALARAVCDDELDLTGDPDAVRDQLLALPGVGPWTADYVLLRGLGAPDAFPAGDLVLRRAVEPGRTLSERALEARAEGWRPWRGYAVFHLWGAAGARPAMARSDRGNGRAVSAGPGRWKRGDR